MREYIKARGGSRTAAAANAAPACRHSSNGLPGAPASTVPSAAAASLACAGDGSTAVSPA